MWTAHVIKYVDNTARHFNLILGKIMMYPDIVYIKDNVLKYSAILRIY